MKVSVVKETFAGESRVALVPANVPKLVEAGLGVVVQTGAGKAAGFSDAVYQEKGATIVDRREAFAADIVLQVRAFGANQQSGLADLDEIRDGQTVIGMCDPLGSAEAAREFSETGATLFALELIPRITRAQSMDVLSSQATVAGYRAVLMGAIELPKMFPMMMTAAGTLTAARVFVIGAGVAGLQAIATAKRLGAVVYAYDVRPVVRDQVVSVGGKFVEYAELEPYTALSEDKGGYAKAMDDEFYQLQRKLIANSVKDIDLVITTAAIPGKQSPLLVTKEAVAGMSLGSVIVDLAAERGGNCECSEPDHRVEVNGVIILGPTNLAGEVPFHASQMYSNNITKFLLNMIKDGKLNLDLEDEIIRETLVTRDGQVANNRVRKILGMEPIEPPAKQPDKVESKQAAKSRDGNSPATIPFDDDEAMEVEMDDETGNEGIADSGDRPNKGGHS